MKPTQNNLSFTLIGFAASLITTSGHAALVPEVELDGASTNNSTATSQFIDTRSFTLNVDPAVFGALPTVTVSGRNGGSDVDFFAFQAAPGTAYFDIDNGTFTFDSYLALFDSGGTLLADNDDSFPKDAGSASDLDAFLGEISLSTSGTYYIAVARYPNFANATFTGTDFEELSRPDGAFGGFRFVNADSGDSSFDMNGVQSGSAYTLHITIPEPAALVGLMVVGWLATARRKSASR